MSEFQNNNIRLTLKTKLIHPGFLCVELAVCTDKCLPFRFKFYARATQKNS